MKDYLKKILQAKVYEVAKKTPLEKANNLSKTLNNIIYLKREDLNVLRPCPKNSIDPRNIKKVIGKKVNKDISKDEILRWEDLD